jgi:hypothetical protein
MSEEQASWIKNTRMPTDIGYKISNSKKSQRIKPYLLGGASNKST